MTTPLPPILQDPSILTGNRIKADYATHTQALRGNFDLSDIAKAQQIETIWQTSNTALTVAYTDLQTRRAARLAVLETTVPVGPSIPAGASAADTALLQQAFRAALTEARAAVPAQPEGASNITPLTGSTTTLDGMLADAEKFDDDNLRRAVLTAAFEAGHMHLVHAWTDMHGVTGQVEEFFELQKAIAGQGFDNLTVVLALGLIPAPDEVTQLPALIAARDAAIIASNRRPQSQYNS